MMRESKRSKQDTASNASRPTPERVAQPTIEEQAESSPKLTLPTTRDRLERQFGGEGRAAHTTRGRLLESHGVKSAPPPMRHRLAGAMIQAKLNPGRTEMAAEPVQLQPESSPTQDDAGSSSRGASHAGAAPPPSDDGSKRAQSVRSIAAGGL